ncbi:hypothetical protein AALP_AA8G357400 [Arabis alpina]|uniref:cytokinin riboside 5'-monophosphate phosphoribohydrolase n=1 Tax=Arabis alpina TaxID=50452 RepID=A0A087GBJ6_ARAAL|nr:hypothetical protein AALP_AA8G357400 [Arabis alpina]
MERGPKFKRICVFCGSSAGNKTSYRDAAIELGTELVSRNIDLVYGGGSIGLMGLISQAVYNGGRHVIGVIPKTLMPREITGETVGEVKAVADMHQRKAEMAKHSDAFIALPETATDVDIGDGHRGPNGDGDSGGPNNDDNGCGPNGDDDSDVDQTVRTTVMDKTVTAMVVDQMATATVVDETATVVDQTVTARWWTKRNNIVASGYGTLEELLEVITWAQLGIHDKPVGLLNVDGYYNSLLSFIDKAVEEGFIIPTARHIIVSAPSAKELVKKLEEYVPRHEKVASKKSWEMEQIGLSPTCEISR